MLHLPGELCADDLGQQDLDCFRSSHDIVTPSLKAVTALVDSSKICDTSCKLMENFKWKFQNAV